MVLRKLQRFVPFYFLIIVPGIAQNLVVNGDFEDHLNCPKAKGSLSSDAKFLPAATKGSTDYFNECGSTPLGIPLNFNGEQAPQNGAAYAGLYLLSPHDYREYIQLKLLHTLEAGKPYRVAFWLSLAEKSGFAIQEASVMFSGAALQLETNKNLSPRRLDGFKIKPYAFLNLTIKGPIYDSTEWVLVEGEYLAKGYENYLIFGNFKNDRFSKAVQLRKKDTKPLPLSYYYMDNVQVEQVQQATFELNVPFVLNRLQFGFDNAELTEPSRREIKKVYLHLKRNPKIKVSIYGHTDDLGTPEYNQYLSSRRARAVARHLQALGLSLNRITWKGKGDKEPIFKGTSTKARDANRRVEFVLTKFEDQN